MTGLSLLFLWGGSKGKWDQPISAGSQHGHPLRVGYESGDREGLQWALELSRDISDLVLGLASTPVPTPTQFCEGYVDQGPFLPSSAK